MFCFHLSPGFLLISSLTSSVIHYLFSSVLFNLHVFVIFAVFFWLISSLIVLWSKKILEGFPGGTVVGNLPASAWDARLSPGPGGSHMPQSGWARALQLLSLCSSALEPQLLSPCAATAEDCVPGACAPRWERPPQWEARAPWRGVAPSRCN